MGLENSTAGGAQGKSPEVILVPSASEIEPKFPKVKGVYFDKNNWVVCMSWKGKRQRFYFSGDAEGYRKAVEVRKKCEQEKINQKIKEAFK